MEWGIQKIKNEARNESERRKNVDVIVIVSHTHCLEGTVNSALAGVPQQHVHGRSSVGSYAPRIGEVPSKDTLSDITCVKIECREADASECGVGDALFYEIE